MEHEFGWIGLDWIGLGENKEQPSFNEISSFNVIFFCS